MEIVKGYPPNIKEIEKVFNLKGKKPIFAYSPILYAPMGGDLDHPTIIHEQTHFLQQGDDPKSWWDLYINNKDFRIEQETEAYSNQFQAFKERIEDRNDQAKYLHILATQFSSDLYGNVLEYSEALKLIKNYQVTRISKKH